jgi:hypothetical protein
MVSATGSTSALPRAKIGRPDVSSAVSTSSRMRGRWPSMI